MFGQYTIVKICKGTEIAIGDRLLFSENIIKIVSITDTNFIGEHLEHIPKHFGSYYKVYDVGDRMKVKSWRDKIAK